MTEDEQHLRLLSIFHYVVGGITALISCFPFIHLFVGIALVTGKIPSNPKGQPMEQMMGWFFILMAGTFILIGWAYAISMLVAGYRLQVRRSYIYCIVMAALSCMNMPFGTVLGVFTIVVLQRPSVKALFGRGTKPPPLLEFD